MRKIVPAYVQPSGTYEAPSAVCQVFDTDGEGNLIEVAFDLVENTRHRAFTLRAAPAGQVRAFVVTAEADYSRSLAEGIDHMVQMCHAAAQRWWTDPATGVDLRHNPLMFPTKAALIMTEIAESIEGDRCSKMDDHLPQYPMRAVELADAVIRIGDLAGAYGIPLGEIVVAKMAYNAQRSDYKAEVRAAAGGKKY